MINEVKIYFQAKNGEYPIFKTARDTKKIWTITNTIATIWGENMYEYLSLVVICSSKLAVYALGKQFASRNR